MERTFEDVWRDIREACTSSPVVKTLTKASINTIIDVKDDVIIIDHSGNSRFLERSYFQDTWVRLVKLGELKTEFVCCPNQYRSVVLSIFSKLPYIEGTQRKRPAKIRYKSAVKEQPYNKNTNINKTSQHEQSLRNNRRIRKEIDALTKMVKSSAPSLTDGNQSRKTSRTSSLRSTAFAIAVKKAYRFTCAVCELSVCDPNGNPEVQSAHIFPKSLNGSDDIRNGLCLCRLHHWAFDVGWFSISNSYEVIVRDDIPQNDDYQFIRNYDGVKIQLPDNAEFYPHQIYLIEHRKLMGLEHKSRS